MSEDDRSAIDDPWPAFSDILAASTLLFLILFAVVAVPALGRAREGEQVRSTLIRIDTTLSARLAQEPVSIDRTGDYVLVRIREDATFPVNRYELAVLRGEGKRILRRIGAELVTAGLIDSIDQVQVAGHTSREGSDELNWRLSASRATTVALFLIDSAGLSPCTVTALGRGKHYPVNPDQARRTADADEADRRIELEIRPIIPSDSLQRSRRERCVAYR
jgi:outer membrane protein OmpA-like peptidoglycan-associated protein